MICPRCDRHTMDCTCRKGCDLEAVARRHREAVARARATDAAYRRSEAARAAIRAQLRKEMGL